MRYNEKFKEGHIYSFKNNSSRKYLWIFDGEIPLHLPWRPSYKCGEYEVDDALIVINYLPPHYFKENGNA